MFRRPHRALSLGFRSRGRCRRVGIARRFPVEESGQGHNADSSNYQKCRGFHAREKVARCFPVGKETEIRTLRTVQGGRQTDNSLQKKGEKTRRSGAHRIPRQSTASGRRIRYDWWERQRVGKDSQRERRTRVAAEDSQPGKSIAHFHR